MLNLKEYSLGCTTADTVGTCSVLFVDKEAPIAQVGASLVCESPPSVLRTLPSIWWLPVCFVLVDMKSDYVQSTVCESTVVVEREG